MADSIKVSMTPDRFMLVPDGQPMEAIITITNAGATVDQYAVECDQLPIAWYSLTTEGAAIFPQDKEEARLVISPPRGGSARAGRHPFTVTVLSRADPTQTTTVEGLLEIGAVAAFELSMAQPSKVTGRRGRYTLRLRNGGNSEIDVALEGSDGEGQCRYRFNPGALHLEPGQQAAVGLTVVPRRNWLVGARKSYTFQVKGTPNVGEEKAASGQLVHRPLFRTADPLRRLALALAGMLVLGAILARLGGPPGVFAHWNREVQPFLCQQVKVACPGHRDAPTPTPTGTPVPCTFVGAFAEFHRQEPGLIGMCLENEFTNARVASQRTAKGLLLFDRRTGIAFFHARGDDSVYLYAGGVIQRVR